LNQDSLNKNGVHVILQVDLPLQLCLQDEVDQFLPTIVAALERRTASASNEAEPRHLAEENHASNTNALTNLSEHWGHQRMQWPQLLYSFVGLPCVDGAIALAPKENDIGVTLVHRVFSSRELKCVSRLRFLNRIVTSGLYLRDLRAETVESQCISAVSLHDNKLLLTSKCSKATVEYDRVIVLVKCLIYDNRCNLLNFFHAPAFVAILHKTMTHTAPHTLHHKAHASHQRQLLSESSNQQFASAALDNIRAKIDLECDFPVLYTGCGAAQCVCLCMSHMVIVSLFPTIPLSASKTSINISAILSARFLVFFLVFSLFTF
jgi:hypothetical protein